MRVIYNMSKTLRFRTKYPRLRKLLGPFTSTGIIAKVLTFLSTAGVLNPYRVVHDCDGNIIHLEGKAFHRSCLWEIELRPNAEIEVLKAAVILCEERSKHDPEVGIYFLVRRYNGIDYHGAVVTA